MDFNNEDLAQQAQRSAGSTLNKFAAPVKQLGKQAGRKAAKAAGKLAMNGMKAVAKLLAKLAAAIIKLLIACWPVALVLLIIILLVAVSFNYQIDERGSSGQLDLSPSVQNPTEMTDAGYLQAIALTEPQAVIDAYYKYMACNSQQKVFLDSDGTVIKLEFDDTNKTSDFASLSDLYENERVYYLSPYFIKMADELLHRGEFFFPEQIIKPVFADFLPLDSVYQDPNAPNAKYITALPIVDDGSANAKALLNAILNGEEVVGAYAIGEDLTSDDGSVLKATYNEDATNTLLATSKKYEMGTTTLQDAEGNYITGLVSQGNTDAYGIWDYGFGAILQYEPMEQEKYIKCSKISFQYHLHLKRTSENEDGSYVTVEYCGDSESDLAALEELGISFSSTFTYEVNLSADTAGSINSAISDMVSQQQAAVDAQVTDDATYTVYAAIAPAQTDLQTMLNGPERIEMSIQTGDKDLAGRIFKNDRLQAAFGNGNRDTMEMASQYPLKVAVISAAATFSGNIRYVYDYVETPAELTDRELTDGVAENWSDDGTKIVYGSGDCGFTGTILRAGNIMDRHPMPVDEITQPMGFQYLEAYDSNYEIYVSDLVKTDNDFQERIAQELTGYDTTLDTDGDGKVTVYDYLVNLGLLQPYFGNTLSAESGLNSLDSLTQDEAALMQQVGCSADAEGEVMLLAKVIAAEAGPNKLDQLMVGAVAYNRVFSPVYPSQNTLIAVVSAVGQYSTWPERIKDANPTPEMIASARQVISGEFALPSNIVFQAGFTQGDGIFLINVNGAGYYTHYYCYKGTGLSTTDIFNRTAVTEESAIRAIAENLHQQDIADGVAYDSGNSGISTPGTSATGTATSEYPLFSVNRFDMVTAVSRMKQVAGLENLEWWESAWASFSAFWQNLFSQISSMFSALSKLGFTDDWNYVNMFNHNVDLKDMRDTVIQAVTFINQDTYSTLANEIDPDALQFIFVGEWAGFGSGTLGGSGTWAPGVGSVFTDFGSPTNSHYNTSEPWTESSGQAVVAVPSDQTVYAVGDSTVSSVAGTGPYEVKMEASADGKSLIIVYGNLSEVSVANGQDLHKGDTVGKVAEGGLIFKLWVDGQNVDPMKYFYQPQFGTGIGFVNLLNESGQIDTDLVAQIRQSLNDANSNITNTYDIYHTHASAGGKSHQSVGECTWWAYGRGLQYCEQMGTLPPDGFRNGYGNGGDYYSQATSQFRVGKAARAGAWIVWTNSSYGHVAFVEAVASDGSIVISQSGRGYWDNYPGDGVNVSIIRNIGTMANPVYPYSSYTFAGFVYLDQPLA